MQTVKMKAVNENPFYGKVYLKSLSSDLKRSTNKSSAWSLLDRAWSEINSTKEGRESFFITCFSVGDITNRQHNIFKNVNVDNGGEACRPQMMWTIQWMLKNVPDQYYKFMDNGIINEYVSWFAILSSQVRTTKGKAAVDKNATDTYSTLLNHDLDKVASYLAKVLKNGSEINKFMLAKWLVNVRTSSRQKYSRQTKEKVGHRKLSADSQVMNVARTELYKKLSELMGWKVITHPKNLEFVGLKEFKQTYNSDFESVLFSSKRIQELDKEQFFNILNNAPSGARYRIQRRLMDGNGNTKSTWFSKFGNVDFSIWFKEWEKFKENKQQEQRDLTEKIRQGVGTKEDIIKLQSVKKEAKVTTGATKLIDMLKDLMNGKANDILIQSIMDKIKFEVPVMVVSDCSGSMGGLPTFIARLLTTTTMLKNPSPDLDDILIRFGSRCEILTPSSKVETSKNRFTTSMQTTKVDKLIDRTQTFTWNFNNISRFIGSNMGGTNLSSVADTFHAWANETPELRSYRAEQLQQYPVVLVVSDGDLNSDSSSAQSMMRFMNTMRQLGWEGVVVVWNVKEFPAGLEKSYFSKDVFENVPNCIHYYGYNLGIINQIFCNIHDLDVIDIYQELKSLWLSNRYLPIKNLVN